MIRLAAIVSGPEGTLVTFLSTPDLFLKAFFGIFFRHRVGEESGWEQNDVQKNTPPLDVLLLAAGEVLQSCNS